MSIRKSAVAGYFYPDDKKLLQFTLHNLIVDALASEKGEYTPKALIVPHAGYPYSGPVAASAYCLLKKMSRQIKRVVLLGPAHRIPVRKIAFSSADSFETPLGLVPVDVGLRDQLIEDPGFVIDDDAHENEHSIEVQLPFLQFVLNENIKILPAVTNMAPPDLIKHFLNLAWGGAETLMVVSSDLSHYLGYDAAQKKDQKTVRAICDFDIDEIEDNDACGASSLKGLLPLARDKRLKPVLLDLRNSGDTSGEKDRVVGYAAFCFV